MIRAFFLPTSAGATAATAATTKVTATTATTPPTAAATSTTPTTAAAAIAPATAYHRSEEEGQPAAAAIIASSTPTATTAATEDDEDDDQDNDKETDGITGAVGASMTPLRISFGGFILTCGRLYQGIGGLIETAIVVVVAAFAEIRHDLVVDNLLGCDIRDGALEAVTDGDIDLMVFYIGEDDD